MREVDRVGVIREVLGRRLRQGEASERLGICVRQVKRLVRRYREEGARGLRSRRRGRRASNAIAPELRREILGVVRERYEDFAPTLAWEKLTEVHGYGVSVETLRKWMVAEGLWRSKKRPGARVHQSRPRRPALVWCLTNTVMKMRGHFGCRQGAMTCRGGFQTRPCGVHHARKSNAADGQRTRRFVSVFVRHHTRRVGADRRFPPRMVRGSGAALHVDRVHRRRHQSADGSHGSLRFAEAETTEAYMRTLRGYLDQPRPPGGHLLGQAQHLPGHHQKNREGDLTQFTRILSSGTCARISSGQSFISSSDSANLIVPPLRHGSTWSR